MDGKASEIDLSKVTIKGQNLRKAAILILALGNEVAKQIFTRLSEHEIRSLGEAAAKLNHVTPMEVHRVLKEFNEAFHGGNVPTTGAGRMFRVMVERALGTERANELLRGQTETDPFTLCGEIDGQVLASVLETEHPQTTAIVLASLPPAKAGAVLEHLGPDPSARVIYRMAHLGTISEEVRHDVGTTLVEQLKLMGSLDHNEKIDGEQMAVDVTKALPGEFSEMMIDSLDLTDEDFAEELRAKLFVFEDLGKLDSRTMQRLLREVDSKNLMVALKGSREEIKSLIFGSMSSRAAEMLRDDMSASPPVRIADVEEAQREILEVAFRLEAEGAIALPRGGAGEMV